jgi:hypothetical protein
MVDETYNGKFTVNMVDDPTRDRLGNPLKPDEIADPTNRYRNAMIYNGKWPPERSAVESYRNPFVCMDETVIRELSGLLAAGKSVTVEPVAGQQRVYELDYELDPKDDPHHLKHRVLVDVGKGWVITRHEQFFPDGKSGRLATCDYQHGEGGLWTPTGGQFRNLWGSEVPDLDWRFKVHRVVINNPRFALSVFDAKVERGVYVVFIADKTRNQESYWLKGDLVMTAEPTRSPQRGAPKANDQSGKTSAEKPEGKKGNGSHPGEQWRVD